MDKRAVASTLTTTRTTPGNPAISCSPAYCSPRGLPARALTLLDRLYAAAAAQGRAGSLIEIQALWALALAADGDGAAALDALAEALPPGHPAGYLRVFADQSTPMRALVGRLVAAQRTARSAAPAVPLDYLARLVRAFDGARDRSGQPTPSRHGPRRAWSRR